MKIHEGIIIILAFASILNGQWEPDRRLTFSESLSCSASWNNARWIAASGSFVHVVWTLGLCFPDRLDVFYKRSTDNGLNWEGEVKLSEGPRLSYQPAVAVSGSNVHVVWEDKRNGNRDIYYRGSDDNGRNWREEVRLTTDPGQSEYPSVAASGPYVHVVWLDSRNRRCEIYYKRSTDNGITWEEDRRLTFNNSVYGLPSVASFGSNVHVVWEDTRNDSGGQFINSEIYYKHSTDNGMTWGEDIRLTFDSMPTSNPSVAAFGPYVHVVWQDARVKNYYKRSTDNDGIKMRVVGEDSIYYKRSTDNGITWGEGIGLTGDSAIPFEPSIAASGSNVHVVWVDERDGDLDIYYKRSTDNGITWEEETPLTNGPTFSHGHSIAVSGACVHVVWIDDRDRNSEVYYKRNPTGNPGMAEDGLINQFAPVEAPYPNPFTKRTTLSYSLLRDYPVKIEVFDVNGKRICLLKSREEKKGKHHIVWDGRSEEGREVPEGVYLFQFAIPNYKEMKKVVKLSNGRNARGGIK